MLKGWNQAAPPEPPPGTTTLTPPLLTKSNPPSGGYCMLNSTLIRLDKACRAVTNVDGVAVLSTYQQAEKGWFVVNAPWGRVRVDGALTPAQQTAIAATVMGFNNAATTEDVLDSVGVNAEAAAVLNRQPSGRN